MVLVVLVVVVVVVVVIPGTVLARVKSAFDHNPCLENAQAVTICASK